jgi:ubiquinone/menaquinone biosynthesis C-methylase UbiE
LFLVIVKELRGLLGLAERLLFLHESKRYGLDHTFLDLPPNPPQWMNLGVWKNLNSSEDFVTACRSTASELADAVDLKPNETVIDVGFGCGDQDFHFLNQYGVSKIIGFNSSRDQVENAIKMCKIRNEKRFEPKYGIAPFLPVQSESADVVLSLDSAYHYNTRSQFIQESWKWLKDDGRIGLVDLVLNDPPTFLTWLFLIPVAWVIGIPIENLYTAKNYQSMMERHGFDNVQIRTIDHAAFSHLPDFIEAQLARYEPILNPALVKKYSITSRGMRTLAKLKIFKLATFVGSKRKPGANGNLS